MRGQKKYPDDVIIGFEILAKVLFLQGRLHDIGLLLLLEALQTQIMSFVSDPFSV